MLLYESDILLLEFTRERGVFVRVASGVVELVLPACRTAVEGVSVHYHVVRATLEAKSLLILVRLGRLRGFPVVLLKLLAPRAH